MARRTKATAIPPDVKKKVFERDGGCVWCGSNKGLPEAHFLSRQRGGLGIEENILTLCRYTCHKEYDEGDRDTRIYMRQYFEKYLREKYPDWSEEKIKYNKWEV